MLIGAHISAAGGVWNAFDRALEFGCETFQIFTKNQNQWREKEFTEAEIEKFKAARQQSGLEKIPLLVHDSYLINLCASDAEKLNRSRMALKNELKRCNDLGIEFLVFHPGAHMGAGESAGVERIAESLRYILKSYSGETKILIETTAGQGTNLGYSFEQVRDILDLTGYARTTGVCVDTCHIFAAGYALNTWDECEKTFQQFDQIVGVERLMAFHLNDSKKARGSRVDRHDVPGQGMIGAMAFEYLVSDKRFENIPGVFEIPGDAQLFNALIQYYRTIRSKHE